MFKRIHFKCKHSGPSNKLLAMRKKHELSKLILTLFNVKIKGYNGIKEIRDFYSTET